VAFASRLATLPNPIEIGSSPASKQRIKSAGGKRDVVAGVHQSNYYGHERLDIATLADGNDDDAHSSAPGLHRLARDIALDKRRDGL
jgi:hypothetical protein